MLSKVASPGSFRFTKATGKSVWLITIFRYGNSRGSNSNSRQKFGRIDTEPQL